MHPDHVIPETVKKAAPIPQRLPPKPRVRSSKLDSLADIRRLIKRMIAEFRCAEGPIIGPEELRAGIIALSLLQQNILKDRPPIKSGQREKRKPSARRSAPKTLQHRLPQSGRSVVRPKRKAH